MNEMTAFDTGSSSVIGRYVLHPAIARGGMATVHPAHLVGEGGFSRLVAAKRLHPQYADDPEFVAMFQDEARIASRIHHPNVVPVLDVITADGEVILVQEYVHGIPLSLLLRHAVSCEEPIAVELCVGVMVGLLTALHASHEAKDDRGEPLNVIHRDVSAQNVMITVDGVPRLLDFGIAKASTCSHHTREGVFKGKLAYMAPEMLRCEPITRQADLYAAGVILWQLLVNRRFHAAPDDMAFVRAVTSGETPPITKALEEMRPFLSDDRWDKVVRLEPVVTRSLARDPADRYATAAEMLEALLAAARPATAGELAEWVRTAGAEHLAKRREILAASETTARSISGVQSIAMRDSEVMHRSSRTPPPAAPSFEPPPLPAGPLEHARRLSPIVPWIATALSLVVVGIVAGMASEAVRAPAPSTALPPPMVVAAAAPSTPAPPAPAPLPSAAPTADVDPTPANAPPRAVHTATPPQVRWTPPPRTAVVASRPPPPPATTAAAPPPASAAPAPSAKVDCNPPFYFEGSKKVFKPACL